MKVLKYDSARVGMYLPYGIGVGKTPLSYVASLERFDLVLDEVTLP